MAIVIEANVDKPAVIVVSPSRANVVLAATQGPSGPPGPAGEAVSTTQLKAAETISGYTAVAIDATGKAEVASSSDSSQEGSVVGIATGGAQAGANVTVQYAGPLTYNGWSFDVTKAVFLGPGGLATQTPPTTGFLQQIGIPLSATTLLVRMGPAITM